MEVAAGVVVVDAGAMVVGAGVVVIGAGARVDVAGTFDVASGATVFAEVVVAAGPNGLQKPQYFAHFSCAIA
jgi:hypothetical protein